MLDAKAGGVGVFETTRRFHTASPASRRPARRPTRGSGLGAAVDIGGDGTSPAVVVLAAGAQAAATMSPSERAPRAAVGRRPGYANGIVDVGGSPLPGG